jgi:hypothetical protein
MHDKKKSNVNFNSVAYQHINRQSFVLSQSSKSTKRERIVRFEKGLIHSCAVVFIACFLLVLAVPFDLSKSPSPAETTQSHAKQINYPSFSHPLKPLK